MLDNLSTGTPEAVTAKAARAVDLADREAMPLDDVFADAHRPAAVVHFAAKCYVGESVEDPSKYYRENVTYTWNLLEAMRGRVRGHRLLVDLRDLRRARSRCRSPRTTRRTRSRPYGRTKLHMEHMIARLRGRAYGLRYAALRYFNAAGAASRRRSRRGPRPRDALDPDSCSHDGGGAARRGLEVFGDDYPTPDGTCVRDYIHVCDLADAHVRALNALQDGTPELVCNLGTGEGFTVKEVVEAARRITGHPIPTRIAPRRPGDPAVLVSGGTRARDLLGWTPRYAALETILAHAWGFHSANPDGFAGTAPEG